MAFLVRWIQPFLRLDSLASLSHRLERRRSKNVTDQRLVTPEAMTAADIPSEWVSVDELRGLTQVEPAGSRYDWTELG